MRRFALALASVAVLAACGSGEPSDEPRAASEPAELSTPVADPAQMPSPSPDGVESVDYSGSYTFTALDGSRSTLTVDKETGTYEYLGPEGTTSSGKFEQIDAARIAIADFSGGAAYFSIAPGALYRLAGPSSAFDEIDPGRMYRRSDYEPEAGPGAVGSRAYQE